MLKTSSTSQVQLSENLHIIQKNIITASLFSSFTSALNPCGSSRRIRWSRGSRDPWRRLQTQHGGTREATVCCYTLWPHWFWSHRLAAFRWTGPRIWCEPPSRPGSWTTSARATTSTSASSPKMEWIISDRTRSPSSKTIGTTVGHSRVQEPSSYRVQLSPVPVFLLWSEASGIPWQSSVYLLNSKLKFSSWTRRRRTIFDTAVFLEEFRS